ncbi:hypothetical protein [Vibrio sp. SCSIO 43137]|uniref:hypothetical protein n=1 Tax=Vibrio sp. SCSIO 43137 TaxID=3021011 RepID=UPI002307D65D|nr:hypothetical protein [Vibrio sp. SCSIO 43137]WCE31083.1 hypothetical protein PK654_07415 [Vibrio sp. SCSIO 43137]
MRWIIVILACISFTVASYEIDNDRSDITQFDHPFLLGDWYLVNHYPDESEQDFVVIRLHITSDYTFGIEIQKIDNTYEYWGGEYSANSDTIVLGMDSENPQLYSYMVNHNQLILNGIYFSKGYHSELVGSWTSEDLKGEEIRASKVSKVNLVLQPDFMFMFKAESTDGNLAAYQGIYYFEGDNLVLMYEKGEQASKYSINEGKLTLESGNFDMLAVLNRIE